MALVKDPVYDPERRFKIGVGRRKPLTTGDPLLVAFFALMDREGLTMAEAERRTGISAKTFKKWRDRATVPQLETLEVALRLMGYRLAIVPDGVSMLDGVAVDGLPAPAPLTPKQFEIFEILRERLGRTVRSDFILEQCAIDNPQTLSVHMLNIRDRLKGSRWSIDNVWGVGFRLNKGRE